MMNLEFPKLEDFDINLMRFFLFIDFVASFQIILLSSKISSIPIVLQKVN